jgi:hypothetical protein
VYFKQIVNGWLIPISSWEGNGFDSSEQGTYRRGWLRQLEVRDQQINLWINNKFPKIIKPNIEFPAKNTSDISSSLLDLEGNGHSLQFLK